MKSILVSVAAFVLLLCVAGESEARGRGGRRPVARAAVAVVRAPFRVARVAVRVATAPVRFAARPFVR